MIEPRTLTHKLPAHALRSLYLFYNSMAKSFLAAAEMAERSEKNKVSAKARKKKIFNAEEMILTYLSNGHSTDSAIAIVSGMTGLDPRVLECLIPRLKKVTIKERRNRQIMNLRDQGRSLSEIGGVVQLHPKSVSRIIKSIRAA